MIRNEISALIVLSFILLGGCNLEQSTNVTKPMKVDMSAPKAIESESSINIEKIVFVGQKQACNCTRERIDKSWKVLQEVMKDKKDVKIERVQLDVDETRYEDLNKLRPLLTAPGMYFFDENGQLVEMLQGELEEYQILSILER